MMDIQSREKTVFKNGGFEFIKKDGARVSTMVASTPFLDESGDFGGCLVIITDTTIRKKAEDALRQSEAYYRTIIETSPNGIVIIDSTFHIRMANLQTAKYLGYPDAQALDGKNIFNFIAPDDIEKCQVFLQKTHEKKNPTSIECKFIKKDSTGFCVDFAVTRLGLNSSENDFFLGVITDITERRKAEALIRRSEIKYRTLVEGLSSIIFTTDIHGKITYISPVVEKILGYRPEDLVDKHFYVLVSSDDRHTLGIKLKEAKDGSSQPFDSQVIDKSGNPHWVRIVAQPVKEHDRLTGLTGLIGDINDWKLTEDALNQCSLKYKAVVEDQTDLICRFSPEFCISFVNPAFTRFFNTTEEKILNSNLIDLIAPSSQDTLTRTIAQLTKESPTKTLELDFLSTIGNQYSYHVTARAIFNSDGDIFECQISCRDITELKSYFERTQKLLREQQLQQAELQIQNENLKKLQRDAEISEKRYRDFYEIAPLANLTLDVEGRIITINPSGALVIGKMHERPAGSMLTDFVEKKYHETFLQFLRDVFSKDERQLCMVMFGDTGNYQRRILIIGKRITAKAGEPAQCRTVLVDITGYED